MSNKNDINILKNDANLEKMGKATAEAIAEKYNLKLRTQGSYDRSHQPVKHQSPYSLVSDNISRVMTFGDEPFIIPVQGGSGNGKINYEFDTLRVFKYENGKIHIIGVDDDIAITSTKGTDGVYLPITSNRVLISVKPKKISLSLSTYVDNHLTITCKANDLVEGFLPKGKAAFYINGQLVERKTFKEDGTCSIVIDDPTKTYNITVKYENVTKGNYIDYYTIPDVSLKYEYSKATPTPVPTASPTPSPTPTITQTTSPTPSSTTTPTGTADSTQEPTSTVSLSPEKTPERTSTAPANEGNDNVKIYIVLLIVFVLVLVVVSVLYFIKYRKE